MLSVASVVEFRVLNVDGQSLVLTLTRTTLRLSGRCNALRVSSQDSSMNLGGTIATAVGQILRAARSVIGATGGLVEIIYSSLRRTRYSLRHSKEKDFVRYAVQGS